VFDLYFRYHKSNLCSQFFLFFFALVIWLFVAYPVHAQNSDIIHLPVSTAEQGIPVAIVAKSFASEDVARALLFFRQLGATSYQKQRMVKSGDEFKGNIPAEMVMPEAVEYYAVFYWRSGKTSSHPANEPEILPHVIFVKSQSDVEWLEVLYPEPNSVILEKRPEISAAFVSGTFTVDEVKIKLDEEDITQKCELTEDFLLYLPEEELAVGYHRLTVQVQPADTYKERQEASWYFRIAGRPPLLTRPNGFASILWQRNDATSDSPFMLYAPGSNVNVTAQLSSELFARQLNVWFNRSSLYQTKYTELSVSLTGKRFQINAGDIFPVFSPLTLDSMPARGGQVDFSIKSMTLSAVAAQTNLFIGEDDILTALLKNRFAGGRAEFNLPYGISPSLVFLYATDSGEEEDAPLLVSKRYYLYSGAINLSLPRRFRISAEWARNEKRNTYESAEIDFESSEYLIGDVFFMRIKRLATPLSVELSYQDVGENFSPEVNPFWESGRSRAKTRYLMPVNCEPDQISTKKRLCLLWYFIFACSLLICPVTLVADDEVIAFFFDAEAHPVDSDSDGVYDVIAVRFDIDLDRDVALDVTVIAKLYNANDVSVATSTITVKVEGQKEGYEQIKLTPNPNIAGTYYVHLMLFDLSDELYLDNIRYEPEVDVPITAYFADVGIDSSLENITVTFDVDLVQEGAHPVLVESLLVDSSGEVVKTIPTDYEISGEEIDPRSIVFAPEVEDAYSVILWVYADELPSDSYIQPVIWPAGHGTYFREYDARFIPKSGDFGNLIEVQFEIDLAYAIVYPVFVESILYNSNGEATAYNSLSYFTNSFEDDRKMLTLSPEPPISGIYYVELGVYVNGIRSAQGYIGDISYIAPDEKFPAWDVNQDGIVDIIDIVFVGRNFGTNEDSADVNGDLTVDILDLVLVGKHFGEQTDDLLP